MPMPKIVSIRKVHFEGWVYDLSTPVGSYAHESGAILKNTDSVYVRWKGCNMKRAFDLSEEAAAAITLAFPPPIQLEFEKVMLFYIFLGNKYFLAGDAAVYALCKEAVRVSVLDTVRRTGTKTSAKGYAGYT